MNIDPAFVRLAIEARERAYAPYSNFAVGAVVKDEHGRFHPGCNVENAAYPEGVCAEAAALAAMVMAGGRVAREIIVIGGGEALVTPCGGCRQKIREFACRTTRIHICGADGTVRRTFTLEQLLPCSFGPDNLGLPGSHTDRCT